MKKSTSHHWPRNWQTIGKQLANNWPHNRSGSIMIWSVMLGFVLTSVFFFFSMRQRATVTIQRDTAEILNAKNYLESYADYLENLSTKSEMLSQTFDGLIEVNLTQKVTEIVDEIDFGAENEYEFSDEILIEWNDCSGNGNGDLLVDGTIHEFENPIITCVSDDEYSDIKGPLTVTGSPATPFKIKTLNTPFEYRITSNTGTPLNDTEWHLDLKMDLEYGRVVEISRTFN